MYSFLAHDPAEVMIVSSIFKTLSLPDRVETVEMEDGSKFSFADLASLHTFLRACAAFGAIDETARRVCEYVMWTLGFRWV
jgi:hypothetical protein